MRIFSRLCPVFALLLLLTGCGSGDTGGSLRVVFPELGSADCAILMTDSATVVIDTGEDEDGEALVSLLQDYGRDTVDLLIISHYDKDHVGGADTLLDELPVARVIGSTSPKDSDDYADYQEALSDAGIQEEHPNEPETISLGGMTITVFPPETSEYSDGQSNNSSTAAAVSFGETGFLFTGDALEERTEELVSQLETAGLNGFSLIKLPHHGREISTAQRLLDAAGTENTICVVTSSKKEKEDDSLAETLTQRIYLTRKGAVAVTSDGAAVSVEQNT